MFTIVDKGMIALAFIIVSLNTIDVGKGMIAIGVDFLSIFFIVLLSYVSVWFAIQMLTGWSAGIAQSSWMRYGLAGITLMATLFAFPLVLSIFFWIFGLQLTIDVETVLTWTFAIRFAIMMLLRRRYNK